MRGWRGVGLPAGGFCIFRESITNSSANISGAWLSAMLGDLLPRATATGYAALLLAISRDSVLIYPAKRYPISPKLILDVSQISDASRIIVAINRGRRKRRVCHTRYLSVNNFRYVLPERRRLDLISPPRRVAFIRISSPRDFFFLVREQFRESAPSFPSRAPDENHHVLFAT